MTCISALDIGDLAIEQKSKTRCWEVEEDVLDVLEGPRHSGNFVEDTLTGHGSRNILHTFLFPDILPPVLRVLHRLLHNYSVILHCKLRR